MPDTRRVTEESILYASKIVRRGGLVVYPTDTVYGLGCDPFDEDSVKKIFIVKERKKKPLPILSFSIEDAKRIALFTKSENEMARLFWPGALTMILRRRETLPSIVTLGQEKVGVRVPNLQVTRELIRLCGGLLIGTSANISGKPPSRTAVEAAQQFGDKVDVILDFGSMNGTESSTVVEIIGSNPRILREGPITLKDIMGKLCKGEV
jgi:L-threonylcarbamoyladenylate synthase